MWQVISILFVLCVASPAWATTRYVSATSGNNANSCATSESSTIGNAKATLTGATGALSCMAAGDTLRMHAGTYTESFVTSSANSDIPNGTSYAAATVIESYNGTVTWNHTSTGAIRFQNSDQYIIIRAGTSAPFIIDGTNGTTYSFALTGANTHHIKFEGLEIRNSTNTCIYSDLNTHDQWITGNYIHDCGSSNQDHGIYMEGDASLIEYNRFIANSGLGVQFSNSFSGGESSNNIFRYNYCQGNGTGCLVIDGDNNQVTHNVMNANTAAGIACGYSPGSDGNLIANNTIHGTLLGYGLQLGLFGSCTNLKVHNNSISNSSSSCVQKESGAVSGTFSFNNCNGNGNNTISVAGATVTNTTTVSPAYVDTSALRFDLQSTSALINAGTPVTGLLYNGSNPDIGAHETIGTCTAVVPDTAGDNTMKISCENNVNPPLLPGGSTAATWTATKNGGGNAVTAVNRSANNEYTLTLTNSYAGGDTCAGAFAVNNVTDSALIGSTYTQRLNAITSITCTNQVAGGTPTMTQAAYRFRCVGGSEASPDCFYPLNTPITIPPGNCISVIELLQNTVADFGATGYAVYASRIGGAYGAIGNGPTPITGISFPTTGQLPPQMESGPTTEHLAGPGAFVPGGVQLSASETPNVTTAAGQDTELAQVLCVGTSNPIGTYFDIEVRKAGGVPLAAYTQRPRIVVGGYKAMIGTR